MVREYENSILLLEKYLYIHKYIFYIYIFIYIYIYIYIIIYIYIYIYIYSRIKNAFNANCLIIDDPLLLCNKDSQGVIINI